MTRTKGRDVMASARHALGRRSFLAGAAALAATGARAQGFPNGPVKIVTSVGPGSSPDVCARVLADYLTRLWGQQVIVLNQPGGAGAVAIKAVAPAAPDGHTLYMSLATNFIALPELQKNFPLDVLRDFVPIGYVGDHPMVIAAGKELGVNTLPEFIALAKKRKGELNIAAGNRGSILHLTGEWLRSATGIDVTLVHYPSATQAITDILGRPRARHDRRGGRHARCDRGRPTQAARGRDAKPTAEFPRHPDCGRDHPELRGGRLAGADGAARARRPRSRTGSVTMCARSSRSRSSRNATRSSAPMSVRPRPNSSLRSSSSSSGSGGRSSPRRPRPCNSGEAAVRRSRARAAAARLA